VGRENASTNAFVRSGPLGHISYLLRAGSKPLLYLVKALARVGCWGMTPVRKRARRKGPLQRMEARLQGMQKQLRRLDEQIRRLKERSSREP